MAINKVIFGGNTLIDLTGDTVTAAAVKNGISFHLPSGEIATGTRMAYQRKRNLSEIRRNMDTKAISHIVKCD